MIGNYQHIKVNILHEQTTLEIVFDQPASYNSFTKAMLAEVRNAIILGNDISTIRCIILTGSDKAFSAGQNLKEALDEIKSGDRAIYNMVIASYNTLVKLIYESKKPVIALVNGIAAGAGANLAFACDLAFAKKSATFIQAFVNISLIPDTGGTYFLPKLSSRQIANYLTFMGGKITADEALKYGLIADVFEDETFEEKTTTLIKRIANAPTQAIYLTKKGIQQSYVNTLEEQLLLEAELQQESSQSEDFKEGVNAFIEKRKPVFKGK